MVSVKKIKASHCSLGQMLGFENTGIVLFPSDTALATVILFMDTSGAETKVEYSFGYVKDKDGKLSSQLTSLISSFSGIRG